MALLYGSCIGKRCNASHRQKMLTPVCIIVLFHFSLFAPISRQEAEFIQQQAPPSYGQLIAQGIIPPVEDFPTENPNEVKIICPICMRLQEIQWTYAAMHH